MKQLSSIISLLLVLVFFTTACISGLEPRMFNSRYSYEISIRYNGTLSDATFIIPLPVKDNSPRLASEIYTKPDFGSRDNVRISLTRSPAGLDWTNTSSLRGYDPWFLVINTQAPVSDASPYYIYQFKRDIRINLGTPDFPVNTLMPIGNETLILPKYNFSWENPLVTGKKSWSRIDYSPQSLPYITKIYADYNAPPSSSVTVYCDVYGHNGWVEGYDAWVGNYYRDRYSKTLNGDAHGWYEAEGKLSIAEGVYRPEWQTIFNQSVDSMNGKKIWEIFQDYRFF
jgi:hypothetical protein